MRGLACSQQAGGCGQVNSGGGTARRAPIHVTYMDEPQGRTDVACTVGITPTRRYLLN